MHRFGSCTNQSRCLVLRTTPKVRLVVVVHIERTDIFLQCKVSSPREYPLRTSSRQLIVELVFTPFRNTHLCRFVSPTYTTMVYALRAGPSTRPASFAAITPWTLAKRRHDTQKLTFFSRSESLSGHVDRCRCQPHLCPLQSIHCAIHLH